MDQEAAVPAVNAYAEAIAQYHLLLGTQQQPAACCCSG